jgi:uncharacterized protein with FMN-binding domain
VRRAPIVAVTTIAGLVGVLSFHTESTPLSIGIAPGKTATRASIPTTSIAAGSPPAPRSTTTTSPPSPAGSSTSTTTTIPSSTRSATGAAVSYNYGVLSVSVTVTGSKITNVRIASLDDGGNFRSQSIDQQSVPILEQEALQAQSANIQSVSGASYTSAGFEQSLHSALTKLGIQ